MTVLDFEKPITEIQEKIDELKKISLESGMDLNKEIETFEQQAEDYKKRFVFKSETFAKIADCKTS